MSETTYTKLGNLVGDTFTIEKVWGYQFQKWDDVNKKMLRSDTWEQGYAKTFNIDTDKGKLTLGVGQLGNLLVEVVKDGIADVNGKTFTVKSNGKDGTKDVRYFINLVASSAKTTPAAIDDGGLTPEEIAAIPF